MIKQENDTDTDDSVQRSLVGFVGPNYTSFISGKGISILENSLNITVKGKWDAQGLIRNESLDIAGSVYVTAKLISNEGTVIAEASAYSPVKNIRPGEPAPFHITTDVEASSVSNVIWTATVEKENMQISRDTVVYVNYEIPYGSESYKTIKRTSTDYQMGTSFANIGNSLTNAVLYAAWMDNQGKVVWQEKTNE